MRLPRFLAASLSFAVLCACSQQDRTASANPGTRPADTAPYQPVHKYDPARDAAADIRAAVAEAARTHRRVLVEVGGEWCIWCHYMDDFFTAHPELTALRDRHYVLLKLNYSEENENQEVLSRYPEITGYPHIFVLDADGSLLHSQNTAELEEGDSYNLERFTKFLETWARA